MPHRTDEEGTVLTKHPGRAFGALVTAAVVAAWAALPAPLRASARPAPPIALASWSAGVLVLQSDGQVLEFDVAQRRVVRSVFSTPWSYQAFDLASVRQPNDSVACLSLYNRTVNAANSWVVQIKGTETIWSWLPERGLYGGMAWDTAQRQLYVANSSTNSIYALPLGRNGPAHFVAGLRGAGKIVMLAYDSGGKSVLAIDQANPAVWRVDPATRQAQSLVRLPKAGELRAAAWSDGNRRLYLADSQKECVWDVDFKASPPRVRAIAGEHLRDPAGLALVQDSLWVADEGERSLFEFTLDGALKQRIPWPPDTSRAR